MNNSGQAIFPIFLSHLMKTDLPVAQILSLRQKCTVQLATLVVFYLSPPHVFHDSRIFTPLWKTSAYPAHDEKQGNLVGERRWQPFRAHLTFAWQITSMCACQMRDQREERSQASLLCLSLWSEAQMKWRCSFILHSSLDTRSHKIFCENWTIDAGGFIEFKLSHEI